MYTYPQNGYPYYYQPPLPSPEQIRKKHLRSDANYIGFIMLLLTLAMQFTFTAVVLLLAMFGFLPEGGLQSATFGLSNTEFLLLYSGIYAFSMGVPAILASAFTRRLSNPFTPSKPVSGSVLFLGILAAIGLCMAANVVTNIITAYLYEWGLPQPEFPQYLEPTLTSLGLNIFVLAVLPGLLEEMVFRGFVLRTLRPYGDMFAVLVSAFLFGLMHGNIAQIPFAFMVGIVLGWFYVATNNIWVSVFIHFLNNALSVCMEFIGFDLNQSERNAFYAIVIYGLAGLGAIFLPILLVSNRRNLKLKNKETVLSFGQRTGVLLSAPAFLISVIIFIVLLILEMNL